ncbi:MAG TPA: undecaprenyldiphospho-muramoylpentapeptide beta-N-acetylglucosaminyltransferase [Desulfobacteraceae bacterium]|nr:undecaprenyldiphospho-muramoylpentapeptide beta-N-acetylglucosaminyltransferase [Desulfobacteraceae bacterium]
MKKEGRTTGASPALGILMAGGGTGGHLFPGIALAQEFLKKNFNTRILFVSTGNSFETSTLSKAGFRLKPITVEGIKGRGLIKQLSSALKIPVGIFQSIKILKEFKPDIVMGMGSYSSGPVALAAMLLGIKIVLCEQNALPGITNRIFFGFASRVYVSFKNTKFKKDSKKIIFTGNPIRGDLKKNIKNVLQKEKERKNSRFNLFITGGSQGAHAVNKAVAEAMEHLKNIGDYHFVHQAGEKDKNRLRELYRSHGLSGVVESFFHDMRQQYEKADLIICRAGGSTVAEITALGKPAIFIPFPFAADDHQVLNAASVIEQEGGEMILEKDITGKLLAEKIEYYASNPGLLVKMGANAGNLGMPHAARQIVDDCYDLIFDSCLPAEARNMEKR